MEVDTPSILKKLKNQARHPSPKLQDSEEIGEGEHIAEI